MEIKAKLNYTRIAPRKVRLVATLIKGMQVKLAEVALRTLPKRSALPMYKLLQSAITSAVHNFQLDKDVLYIKNVYVDAGSVLKRYRPRAFGRTAPVRKRTSRVTLVLESQGIIGSLSPSVSTKTGSIFRPMKGEDRNEGESRRGRREEELKGRVQRSKPIEFVRRVFRRKAI